MSVKASMSQNTSTKSAHGETPFSKDSARRRPLPKVGAVAAAGGGLIVALTILAIWLTPAPAQASEAWPPAPVRSPADACAGPLTGSNKTINVGPGHEHSELTTVPWLSLSAGDVVNIHLSLIHI